jgi:hypothetical protein
MYLIVFEYIWFSPNVFECESWKSAPGRDSERVRLDLGMVHPVQESPTIFPFFRFPPEYTVLCASSFKGSFSKSLGQKTDTQAPIQKFPSKARLDLGSPKDSQLSSSFVSINWHFCEYRSFFGGIKRIPSASITQKGDCLFCLEHQASGSKYPMPILEHSRQSPNIHIDLWILAPISERLWQLPNVRANLQMSTPMGEYPHRSPNIYGNVRTSKPIYEYLHESPNKPTNLWERIWMSELQMWFYWDLEIVFGSLFDIWIGGTISSVTHSLISVHRLLLVWNQRGSIGNSNQFLSMRNGISSRSP